MRLGWLIFLIPHLCWGMELQFLKDFEIPTGTTFEKIEFGGISGLHYDETSEKLYAISDDRSEKAPARIYELSLKLEPFQVTYQKQIPLLKEDGNPFPKMSVDPEGIAFSKGEFWVSTEGSHAWIPRQPPEIYRLNQKGQIQERLEVYKKFLPTKVGPIKGGIRDNLGFEGLSVCPGGKYLYVGVEASLYQDGPVSSFKNESMTRLIRYNLENKKRTPREFIYRLEKVPTPEGVKDPKGDNGVSEVLCLDKETLLVLERSFVFPPGVNSIRLYQVDVSKASNLVRTRSVQGNSFRAGMKDLVLDFDSILSKMTEGKQKLDNIEAMTFGPKLKNGNRTLIFASDNNFNPKQRTLFLLFEVIDGKKN